MSTALIPVRSAIICHPRDLVNHMTAGASRLSKMLTLLLLIATCVYALPTEYDDQWEAWKTEYNKVYKDDIEEAHRKEIWMKHLVYVEKHNAQSDVYGYTLAMNLFAD